jgi:RNA polymerase sigma-70 factor (ECF subfamily)
MGSVGSVHRRIDLGCERRNAVPPESEQRRRPIGYPHAVAEDSLLLSTARLLERARGGDDVALEALYKRYLGPLRRWARGRLPGWARGAVDTDDLVQESLLGSLRNLGGFTPERSGAFQHYLREALRNRLRDELRRAGRRPPSELADSDLRDPGLSPAEVAIGRERLERFETALASLSSADRDAVVARLELGLPYVDVAELLGKPSADAARMAVKRAIARLAHAMAEGG